MTILLTIIALAIAFSAVGSFTFWPVTGLENCYRPIVLLLAGLVGFFLLIFILIFIIGLFEKRVEREKPTKYAQTWTRLIISFASIIAGARCKLIGKEKIPSGQKFLLVSNHLSNFDPIVAVKKLGKENISFICKKSIYKIPFINSFLYGACYLPIDRKDPIQSLGVMKKAIGLISSGAASVGVYPEGTRHKDGVMGDFHEGVFSIAIHSKCPIVVAVTRGTNKIHKKIRFGHNCEIEILKVIPFEEYDGQTAKAISDQVRELIANNL